ncbi:hypothetical protein GCM10028808_39650 [Spirosoma migulaei]
MKTLVYLFMVYLIVGVSESLAQEVLTNQSISAFVKAKISRELILENIRNNVSRFDVSPAGLIMLKEQAVTDPILEAMIQATSSLPVLYNDSVVRLYYGKLSRNIIAKLIAYSETKFDFSEKGLVQLKTADLPDALVKAMMAPKPTGTNNTGVASGTNALKLPDRSDFSEAGLYYDANGTYEPMEATTTNQTRQGTFGEALVRSWARSQGVWGTGSTRRAGLANKTANMVITNNRPIFYLVLQDVGQRTMNGVAESVFSGISSPNDLVLIKVKSNSRGREIIIGRETDVSSETGFGVGAMPFRFKRISPGFYQIYLEKDLPAGEYAFLYNKGSEFTSSLKLFDFSLKAMVR